MEKIIDCKGMACPLPVVNAKKAAEAKGENFDTAEEEG